MYYDVFILQPFLHDSWARYRILGWQLFVLSIRSSTFLSFHDSYVMCTHISHCPARFLALLHVFNNLSQLYSRFYFSSCFSKIYLILSLILKRLWFTGYVEFLTFAIYSFITHIPLIIIHFVVLHCSYGPGVCSFFNILIFNLLQCWRLNLEPNLCSNH